MDSSTATSFDERAKEREKKREEGDNELDDDEDDDEEDEDEEDEEARLEEEINAAALQDSNQLIIGSIAERMGVSMNADEDEETEGSGTAATGEQVQTQQPTQTLSAGHLLNNIAIVSSQQQKGGQEQGQPLATPTSGKSTRTLLPVPSVPPPPAKPGTPVDDRQITVTWRDLTYTVEARTMSLRSLCASADDLEEAGEGRLTLVRHTKRTILKGVNGHFATGRLTAVMGPSGSGKSTMLECIVGFRKRGLTGDIRVAKGDGRGDQSNDDKMIKMALISQSDYLIESFTVREMLVYASRLKNWRKEDEEEARLMKVVVEKDSGDLGSKSSSKRNLLDDVEEGGGGSIGGGKVVKNVHQKLALSVCAQLGLDVCIDTRAGSCSGGQKKRISIALEMISKPSILILDEPTSGLDSSACYQTVTVMQRLAKNERNPTAVVATIHQPSARVFALFDHVYVISYNGHCIYEGSPKEMLAHLTSVGLRCPQFHNPADYIAEVASGEYGPEALDKLIDVKRAQDTAAELATLGDGPPAGSSRSLAKYSESNAYPTMLHLWILLQRTTMHILRDPMLNSLRLLSHLLTALFIGLLYGPSIGKPSLCPPLTSPLNDLENFPAYRLKFQEETVTSTENLAFIFFTLMFVMFGSMMPTIMTFPENLTNIRKEKINGWYSIGSYYVALSLAEIPFQVIYPVIFCIVAYLMTGQLLEPERLSYFLLIHVIMAFVSQSLGLLLGAIFMEDASAAVFLGPISTVPIMLFGGFFVRISTIPWYLRYFTYLSYLRYAFEASMVTVYGFSRCKLDPSYVPPDSNATSKPEWMGYATMVLGEGGEKFVDSFARTLGGTYDPSNGNTYHSALLDQYNIEERYFFFNIAALLIFFLILRIITYMVLVFKINKKD